MVAQKSKTSANLVSGEPLLWEWDGMGERSGRMRREEGRGGQRMGDKLADGTGWFAAALAGRDPIRLGGKPRGALTSTVANYGCPGCFYG